MSTQHYLSERGKYSAILQLAREQVAALRAGDMPRFHSLLDAKGRVIASLRGGRTIVANDASVATIVALIRDTEQTAEKLLYERLGQLRLQLHAVQHAKLARRAYATGGLTARRPDRPAADAPRLMDLHS